MEAETGKGADALDRRPQLAASLAAAHSAECFVLVSKLDRATDRLIASVLRQLSAIQKAGVSTYLKPVAFVIRERRMGMTTIKVVDGARKPSPSLKWRPPWNSGKLVSIGGAV